jgi:hypothetical protein
VAVQFFVSNPGISIKESPCSSSGFASWVHKRADFVSERGVLKLAFKTVIRLMFFDKYETFSLSLREKRRFREESWGVIDVTTKLRKPRTEDIRNLICTLQP